ncbi:sulfite exporter TauE/SafE family protein [Rhodococcus sp. NPDC060176]|uniref:sulfite exporter TauE/SafE family protein n=1 Tax=Rhodococcus sp. NPDC060176 TaxID=3347062 RepID=UPI003669FC7D
MILFSALAVAVAGALHRISGLGFAVVAVPMLIVVNGPVQGAHQLFLLGLCVSLLLLCSCWKAVNWPLVSRISATGLVFVPLGVWMAFRMSDALMSVMIGVVLVTLLALQSILSPNRKAQGSTEVLATGILRAVSGLSAAVLTASAMRGEWQQEQFVPSRVHPLECRRFVGPGYQRELSSDIGADSSSRVREARVDRCSNASSRKVKRVSFRCWSL